MGADDASSAGRQEESGSAAPPLSVAATDEIEAALRAQYEQRALTLSDQSLPRGVEPVLTVLPAAASPGLRGHHRQRTERMLLPSPLRSLRQQLVAPAASPELIPKPSRGLCRALHVADPTPQLKYGVIRGPCHGRSVDV